MARDLHHPRWMYLKAAMLLTIGVLASTLLIIEHPHWRTIVLLAIAIWAFCRAYYFAFYVIEHYINPGFRYAGLWQFIGHLLSRRPGDLPSRSRGDQL